MIKVEIPESFTDKNDRRRFYVRSYNSQWRKENPEKNKETQRRSRSNNRQSALDYGKKYRESHPGKQKEWRNRNRERANSSKREWYSKHRDHVNELKRKWRASHPDSVRLGNKRRYSNLTVESRAKVNAGKRAYYARNRESILKKQRESIMASPSRRKAVNDRSAKWLREHPERQREIQMRRRARKLGSMTDDSAKQFYTFVRSRKSIPCYYCGTKIKGTDAHIDHVVALSKGGNHCSSNLCASCAPCNFKKSNKTLARWNESLTQPVLL